MARKTEFRIEYSDKFNNSAEPWNVIATSESQGTANLLAKLWTDHVELDQWRAGSQTRVVNTRTGAVVFSLTVRELQPEPHPSIAQACDDPNCLAITHEPDQHDYGWTAECINCKYTEESDSYGGFDCPECEGAMVMRRTTKQEAEQRDACIEC